jgi:hypothetical protein
MTDEETQNTEGLSNLPKVTQLLIDRSKKRTHPLLSDLMKDSGTATVSPEEISQSQ